jgi:hypothetical protein
MNRQDIEKLLGGYATGTLTPEERRALFAAALEDQELFDMLAREQALRDLLAEPDARARLLVALGERTPVVTMPLWRRPAVAALAAGIVVAAVALTLWPVRKGLPAPEHPVMVAQVKEAPAPSPARVDAKQVASMPAKPAPRVAAPRRKEKETETPPARETAGTATLKLPEVPERRTYTFQPGAAPLPAAPGVSAAAPAEAATPRTFRSDAVARRVESGPQPARPAERAPEQVRIGGVASLVKAGQREPVLRYTIVRAASDGTWVPVESATVETGVSVRFRVEPEQYGRIELIEIDASGKPRVAAAADATPGTPCDLPASGLRFEDAGYRQFILRLSGSGSFTRIVLNIKRP